mgnify:CR=1 FL=1
MDYQQTVNKEFRLTGPGLHTGRTVTVTVKPAPENFGIAFRRIDHTNIVTQHALADRVGGTARGTTLGSGRNAIATIEHLMSALHGMCIDNVLVELDGGEVPILDGSSRPWMLQLARVGVRRQSAERRMVMFKEHLHFEFDKTGSVFDIEPDDHFSVHCEIDFANSVIGHQAAEMNALSEYAASIAPCRTFVFLHEVEPLLHLNLIKGGSLDNALVFVNKNLTSAQLKRLAKTFKKDVSQFKVHDGVLNTTDIYFPNEPARHKLLDFVGDIRLVGPMLGGRFRIYKPGHKANNAFARYLMDYIDKNSLEFRV